MPRILVGAHRGAMGYAPENSLAAFERAVACGTDRCEFDVRLSADGHVVVMHDETVERTTGGTGRVDQMTLAELRQLRLEDSDEPVPTFDEAAACLRDRCDMLVEIKAAGMVEALLAAISDAGVASQCTISSFLEDSLRQVHTSHAGLAIACFVLPGVPFDVAGAVTELGASMAIIPPGTHRHGVDPDLLAQARAGGLHLRCGLSDDLTRAQTRAEVERLIRLGIQEISCGRPDWIRQALDELAAA